MSDPSDETPPPPYIPRRHLLRRAIPARPAPPLPLRQRIARVLPVSLPLQPLPLVLLVTTCLALPYFAWGVNSWRFALVGDEWAFYSFAKDIAAGTVSPGPLDPHGVYGSYAVLGSLYQALFIKVLGASSVAWRFSNVLLIVPISFLFFAWLCVLFDQVSALLSTIILQTSFLLANIFKIGYINPQAVALLLLCLYMASRSAKVPSWQNMALLGLALGVSAYIYIGPIFLFIVWPCLLPLLSRSPKRPFLPPVALAAVLYVALLVPVLSDPLHRAALAHATSLAPQYAGALQPLLSVLKGFLLFFTDQTDDHFISGPYLDLVTQVLALAGMVFALLSVAARRRYEEFVILLLTYASAIVTLGLTSPYGTIPTVRGMILIPFGAAFAGIVLRALVVRVSLLLAIPVLGLIGALNVYQSQVAPFRGAPYSSGTQVLAMLWHAHERHPIARVVLLLSADRPYNDDVLFTMREAYGLYDVPFEVQRAGAASCARLAHSVVLITADDPGVRRLAQLATCPPALGVAVRTI